MRILVRVVEDAGDRDLAAADLPGDVAIKVFGGDDFDRLGRRGGSGGDQNDEADHEMAHGGCDLRYIITYLVAEPGTDEQE